MRRYKIFVSGVRKELKEERFVVKELGNKYGGCLHISQRVIKNIGLLNGCPKLKKNVSKDAPKEDVPKRAKMSQKNYTIN